MSKKVKVIFNREGCIGCGTCNVVCANFWEMGQDGKSELLGSIKNHQTGDFELESEVSEDDFKCLKESSDSCPAQVIKVEDR